jgi:hypothetical protein
MLKIYISNFKFKEIAIPKSRAGHVERYQLQSYLFKPFFVTL